VTGRFQADLDPDIGEVWRWFEFQTVLTAEERARVLNLLAPRTRFPTHSPHLARFKGQTRPEVNEFFEAQTGRLEFAAMLDLLATTEAYLRNDLRARVAGSKKGGLSNRYRIIRGTRADKIRLDEDILESIEQEGAPAGVVSAVRGALKLRHWLAHGRYWHPRLGQSYAPSDVYDIASKLIDSLTYL
jgi:hypothetical protein